MPIYEYQCKACDIVTDFLQKMSDEPMLTCPECDTDALKKLVSAPRFRLAGSGWYETDFKEGDNKRNLVSSDNTKADDKTDAKKSSAKSETKPESKSEGQKTSDSKSSETKSTKAESKSKAPKTNTTSTSKNNDGKAA